MQCWASRFRRLLQLFQVVKVGPAIHLRWLDSQLGQNRHDLSPMFRGVVDRLGEQDRFWDLAQRTVPVDFNCVGALEIGSPFNQARAGSVQEFFHVLQRHWWGIFREVIWLAGADAREV